MCGFPLPRTTVYRVVRDDSDPVAVASVMDGNVNCIVCPNCEYKGWITIPLLWVDRAHKRAVFVENAASHPGQSETVFNELAEIAFGGVDPEDREAILGRLQQVKWPTEIRAALKLSPEQAEAERKAYDAFLRRDILPLPERLEQAIRDMIQSGAFYAEGRELSREFLALAEGELAKIAENDMSSRAQSLRQLVPNLAERIKTTSPQETPPVPAADWEAEGGPKFEGFTAWINVASRDSGEQGTTGKRGSAEAAPVVDFAGLAGRAASENDASERVAVLRELTSGYLNAGLPHEAAAAAREFLKAAGAANDQAAGVDALVFAAAAAARSGDGQAAINYLAHAEAEIHKMSSVSIQTLAYGAEIGGDAYMLVRRFPDACRQYQRALELYERDGRADGIRVALGRLANACMRAGDLDQAIAADRRLVDELGDTADGIRTRLNLGGALATASPPPELTVDIGFTVAPKSSPETQTAERLDAPAPAAPPGLRCRIEAKLRTEVGRERVLFETIVGDEAIDQMTRARNDAIRIGADDLELSAYDFMVNAFLGYHMRRAARDVLQLSIKRHEELGRSVRPYTVALLGAVWEATAQDAGVAGDQDEARNAWTRALGVFERAERESAARGELDAADEIRSMSKAGQSICLEALGRHAEARDGYRRAMGMFEGARQYLIERDQKEFVQGRSMILFSRAQRNNLALYASTGDAALLEESFYFADAGRSRILLDEIGAAGIARPVTVEDIAGGLPHGAALVQYSLMPTYPNCAGSWAIYTIVPRTGLAPFVIQQNLDQVLKARDALYSAIDTFQAGQWHDFGSFNAALEDLGSLLLPPQLVEFLRRSGVTRIIFAPEAYLMDVPFAALRVRWNGTLDDLSRGGIETIVVPSASVYVSAGERRAKESAAHSLLCISDPNEDLPGVTEWIDQNVRSTWPGKSEHLSKTNAVRSGVFGALPQARVVFYFGHGDYEQNDIDSSGLLLHDDPLTFNDLLDTELKLDCDLFLALACFGARVDADWHSRETVGFSSALLQSGVRNVVAGLWPMTVGFATAFGAAIMRHLAARVPIADACRRALIETRDADPRWAHPWSWAGVRLTGTGS
jgi:tetratricopeptide (TPR) repeat protein